MIESKDVKRVLRDIAREKPDTLNPWTTRVDEEGIAGQVCLYTDPVDPERHCIAGEAFVRLGLKAPRPAETRSVYALIDQEGLPISDSARSLLWDAQQKADQADGEVVNPQPWGKVVEEVLG